MREEGEGGRRERESHSCGRTTILKLTNKLISSSEGSGLGSEGRVSNTLLSYT